MAVKLYRLLKVCRSCPHLVVGHARYPRQDNEILKRAYYQCEEDAEFLHVFNIKDIHLRRVPNTCPRKMEMIILGQQGDADGQAT